MERAARIRTVDKFSLDGEILPLEALVQQELPLLPTPCFWQASHLHGGQQHWNLWGIPLSCDAPVHPDPPVPATYQAGFRASCKASSMRHTLSATGPLGEELS